jgi:hypothetical protein
MDVTQNVHRTSAAVALRLTGERPDRGNRLMATVPGFAKDFIAGASSRWRSQRLPRSYRRGSSRRRSALSTNHAVWIPAIVGKTTMRRCPLRRLQRGRGLLRRDPERGNGVMLRHGRACPDHPRPSHATEANTWMPARHKAGHDGCPCLTASPWRKSYDESPFGALKRFQDMRDRSACAGFLILLRAPSAGFSTRPARPLRNCQSSGMRRCQPLEPRKTRTLVSSP